MHHPCGRKVERNLPPCQETASPAAAPERKALHRGAEGISWRPRMALLLPSGALKGSGLVRSHLFFMILYLIHFMRNLILLVIPEVLS